MKTGRIKVLPPIKIMMDSPRHVNQFHNLYKIKSNNLRVLKNIPATVLKQLCPINDSNCVLDTMVVEEVLKLGKWHSVKDEEKPDLTIKAKNKINK